jgi:hypothetical protein
MPKAAMEVFPDTDHIPYLESPDAVAASSIFMGYLTAILGTFTTADIQLLLVGLFLVVLFAVPGIALYRFSS